MRIVFCSRFFCSHPRVNLANHWGRLATVANAILILSFLCFMTQTATAQTIGQESKFAYDQSLDDSPNYAHMKANAGLPEGMTEQSLTAKLEPNLGKTPRHFGWFIYGGSNSRSLATMLIESSDAGSLPRLFVDANRDKQFDETEELPAVESKREGTAAWQTNLNAEFVKVANKVFSRQLQQVKFRWNEKDKRLTISSVGTMKGKATFGEKKVAAQYLDRNSNGSWFDKEDRFVVDVNQDGILDPMLERYPCKTLCRIGSQQFAIGGDPEGNSLSLVEVTGRGTIAGTIKLADGAEVVKLKATLASTTGIRVLIDTLDEAVTCPIGDYRVESVEIKLKAEKGFYDFRFASLNQDKPPVRILADQSSEIDLLGKLSLSATQAIIVDENGATLTISPMVGSESGLYLMLCRLGSTPDSTSENRMSVESTSMDGQIGLASSGFS